MALRCRRARRSAAHRALRRPRGRRAYTAHRLDPGRKGPLPFPDRPCSHPPSGRGFRLFSGGGRRDGRSNRRGPGRGCRRDCPRCVDTGGRRGPLVALIDSYNLAAELLQSDRCHAANDSHFFPDPARRVSITFHRAFDRCRRPYEALEQIIGLGCDRILTSGQEQSALEGCALLGELRRRARGRIGILPGGGVTPGNAARILERTGCTEIHASASVTRDGKKVTDAGRVAEILRAING